MNIRPFLDLYDPCLFALLHVLPYRPTDGLSRRETRQALRPILAIRMDSHTTRPFVVEICRRTRARGLIILQKGTGNACLSPAGHELYQRELESRRYAASHELQESFRRMLWPIQPLPVSLPVVGVPAGGLPVVGVLAAA